MYDARSGVGIADLTSSLDPTTGQVYGALMQPERCPICNHWMDWTTNAPGGGSGEYRCKVCELRTENDILRESRDLLAAEVKRLQGDYD
jgi:hypothetical protein